jgi:hypothetical protein
MVMHYPPFSHVAIGVHSLISLRDGSVLAASMGGASVWDGDRLRSAVYSGEVCQPSSLVEVGPSQASLSIKVFPIPVFFENYAFIVVHSLDCSLIAH